MTVATRTAEHARRYAEHGWRVFPIRPRTKRPLSRHGSTDATDNAGQVADWWRRWPYANIGALVPAGLVVVDLDPRNGCTLDPDRLPETLTVRTGGGGWHCYFRSSANLRAHSDRLPGVDLLTAGRQVILPPSLHPSGERYVWTTDVSPARLPGRLVDAFECRVVNPSDHAVSPSGVGYIDAARHGVVDHLTATATPGNRWRALTAAALRYRDPGLTVDDAIADVLPAVPTAPDFTDAEVSRTITSVWR